MQKLGGGMALLQMSELLNYAGLVGFAAKPEVK